MPGKKVLMWCVLVVLFSIIIVLASVYLTNPRAIHSERLVFHKAISHNGAVRSVKFSPDNKWMATCSIDSTIRIWDIESAQLLKTFRQPHGITYISISPDGSKIASTSYDGIMRIWNIESERLVSEFPVSGNTLWCISFSPDGKLLAYGGDDGNIYLTDVITGKNAYSWKAHQKTVWSIKFSPDGKQITSGSFDKFLKTWAVGEWKPVRASKAHDQAIVDLAYSHNGKYIATTGDDSKIKIWNTVAGSLFKKFEVNEHVQAVSFSADDSLLLTGGRDRSSPGELIQNFAGESKSLRGISARLWDIHTGKIIHSFNTHLNDVNDVDWSSDNKWIATASEDKTVQVWRVLR